MFVVLCESFRAFVVQQKRIQCLELRPWPRCLELSITYTEKEDTQENQSQVTTKKPREGPLPKLSRAGLYGVSHERSLSSNTHRYLFG